MKKLDEFINDKASRKKSAQAKLELLINGVHDAPELFTKYARDFKEEHYAFNNGNWGVDKSRLTPTEILLPGGIVSKLHIRPDSPLRLIESGHSLILCKGNDELSEFRFLPRPNFWNKKMKDGDDPKRYAQMYGLNCLNFNIYSGCEFQEVGKGCKFCSVKATVDEGSSIHKKKTPEKLAEICQMATESDQLRYILITGGSYIDSDYEFDKHIETLKAIRYNLPWQGRIKGNVSMMPPKNMDKLKELFECGVDYPSFNLEVWPHSAFRFYCPGKEKYVGFEHILNSLKQLVKLYGLGKVCSNFVLGLVPLEDMMDGFQFMAENGIIPSANIYHAEVKSVIGNSFGNIEKEYIVRLYSYASELYHKYNYKPFFDASIMRNSLINEFFEGLL